MLETYLEFITVAIDADSTQRYVLHLVSTDNILDIFISNKDLFRRSAELPNGIGYFAIVNPPRGTDAAPDASDAIFHVCGQPAHPFRPLAEIKGLPTVLVLDDSLVDVLTRQLLRRRRDS